MTDSFRIAVPSVSPWLSRMLTSRTLVALATYNEIENLPSLTAAILDSLPNADLLVVDDNSPDGTGVWCDRQSEAQPRLRCIHRANKQGLGSAALAAIRYAIDRDYEVLVTLDADWSHDPRYLPELLAALDHADVAIGSRYCPGGSVEGWPWQRRLMSRTLNALSGALLRLPVRDTSGAFRAYRTAALQKLDLERLQGRGYDYLEESAWRLNRAGAKFAEVPITFRERRAGRSKIDAREAVSKLRTLFRLARASH
jgi:dolichol-phosphate mannosyltransferase